jgi:hypothetical protein
MRYDDPRPPGIACFCAICGARGGNAVRWVAGLPEASLYDTGTFAHRECVAIVRHRRRIEAAEAVP